MRRTRKPRVTVTDRGRPQPDPKTGGAQATALGQKWPSSGSQAATDEVEELPQGGAAATDLPLINGEAGSMVNGGLGAVDWGQQALDSQVMGPEGTPPAVPAPREPLDPGLGKTTKEYQELRAIFLTVWGDLEYQQPNLADESVERTWVGRFRSCLDDLRRLSEAALMERQKRGWPVGLTDEERVAAAKEHAAFMKLIMDRSKPLPMAAQEEAATVSK